MSSSRPTELRVGIVGGGFMSGVHARAVARSGEGLVSVAAAMLDQAQGAANAWKADRASTVDDLLDVRDIDVVYILHAPNHLHEEQVLRVFAAGRHVICEKPLVTTSHGARRLTELAAAEDRVASVPFVYPFYGAVREARARIARGDAGNVLLVHDSFLQDWRAEVTGTNSRIDPAKARGSTLRKLADRPCERWGLESVPRHRYPLVRPSGVHHWRSQREHSATMATPGAERAGTPSARVPARSDRGRGLSDLHDGQRRHRVPGRQPSVPQSQEPPLAVRRRRACGVLLRPGEPQLTVDWRARLLDGHAAGQRRTVGVCC